MFDWNQDPHRRFNPLTREWVLVSPHRTERPWQGQVESVAREQRPSFDPKGYLCPGNVRAGGVRNPAYTATFVFDNDFAALKPDVPSQEVRESELLIARSETGRCRVVCFSPRRDLTTARISIPELRSVVDVWVEQSTALGNDPRVQSVQIFENRGEIMGCSTPHPHGPIWACETLPNELAKELESFGDYHRRHAATLLGDYLTLELEKQERLVCANDCFVVLVPYWAVWPVENLLVST